MIIKFFANLSPTQSVRPHLAPYTSLCSTCVTYRTSCLAIGQQVLPTQLFLRKQKISLRVASSSRCASAHILSLLAISLIKNSGLIFVCVKTINVITCAEEIRKLAVWSSMNYYSFQSAANLSIYENSFKNCSLNILVPKKLDFKKHF